MNQIERVGISLFPLTHGAEHPPRKTRRLVSKLPDRLNVIVVKNDRDHRYSSGSDGRIIVKNDGLIYRLGRCLLVGARLGISEAEFKVTTEVNSAWVDPMDQHHSEAVKELDGHIQEAYQDFKSLENKKHSAKCHGSADDRTHCLHDLAHYLTEYIDNLQN
ncbi:MAG: hypothetical protein WCF65_06615 [Parachlamydiaceae bacterium]